MPWHNQRFFAYLSAFTGGMLVLVFGGNYFVMFVGGKQILNSSPQLSIKDGIKFY